MKQNPVIAIDLSDIFSVLGGRNNAQSITTDAILEQARAILTAGPAYFSIVILEAEFTDAGEFVRTTSQMFTAKQGLGGRGAYIPAPNTASNNQILSAALTQYKSGLEYELNNLVSNAVAYYREHTPNPAHMAGLVLIDPV